MLIVLRTLTALIAFAQIYIFRFQVFQEDAVSYLDLSDYAMQGNWVALCNGHFCPLYAVLIALARALLHLPLEYEPLLLKIVNFVCFSSSWIAFEYLLRVAFDEREEKQSIDDRGNGGLFIKCVLYCAFIYGSFGLSGLQNDTPDYLTNTVLFCSSAMLLQLRKKGASVTNCALLGLVLGLGFLAKTIAFYFGLIFIAAAVVLFRKQKSAIPKLAALIGMFVLVCAPFIITLSRTSGHLTLGDSGKLSWVAYIAHLSDVHARTKDFIHPSRIIHDVPPTYEFGGLDTSTYSAFFNQSYWYDGASMVVPISNVIEEIGRNVLIYLKHGMAAVLLSGALFWVLTKKNFLSVDMVKHNWFLFAVPLIAMGMYAVVTPLVFAGNTRYYSGLLILLVTACLMCQSQSTDVRIRNAKKLTAGFFCLALLLSCLSAINTDYEAQLPAQTNEHWALAQELKQLGIRPNDRICLLGFRRGGFGKHYYFARLVGAKITADIPDEETFWKLPDGQRQKIMAELKKTGIKAIVEYPWSYDPPVTPPPPWKWMHLGNCWALMI